MMPSRVFKALKGLLFCCFWLFALATTALTVPPFLLPKEGYKLMRRASDFLESDSLAGISLCVVFNFCCKIF
jgi:hypothetical protein